MEQLRNPAAVNLPVEAADSIINITVVATSPEATSWAMRKAESLGDRLGARITLLVIQLVPRPLDLDHPPVEVAFNEQRFREIASSCTLATSVRIHLCRDREQTLPCVLDRKSIVVVGGRRRWWVTAERRLAHRLRKAGFDVVLEEME